MRIDSLIASSLGADSVYGLSDQITITFSEDTNMGGSYQGQVLSPAQVNHMFNFTQDLGIAFTGSWTSPKTFQFSIEGSAGGSPPEIGHLQVGILEAADIRNKPPQSSATVDVTSPLLVGNFGPSSMEIVAFTAHDPENSANVVKHFAWSCSVIVRDREILC